MDNDLLLALEEKITNIGANDIYKKKIGNLVIWFAPLSYTDQAFVQEALEATIEAGNSINTAKLKAISRSIVGIDDVDLREFRNGAKVFEVHEVVPNKGRTKVKVDLAKYMEYKIRSWGQSFVDLAFDVFADIEESSKKKFAEGVVLENTKDPRVELAELEVRVHELRSRLGLPVLAEKEGSRYKNLQGEPEVPEDTGPTPDLGSMNYEEEWDSSAPNASKSPSVDEQTSPDEPETVEPVVEAFASEEDILQSVVPPEVEKPQAAPVPVRTVPVAQPAPPPPAAPSPIHNALSARRNMARPVHAVPPNAYSSPDKPFDATPSVNREEVIEDRLQPQTSRIRMDPSVSQQSVNPRFKSRR